MEYIKNIYTITEFEVQWLLRMGVGDTRSSYTPHDAGNKIIQLAEQIKAERAVIAMEE